ncbi:ral-GDS-related protein-like [Manis pentadactyla]|uniref:ral-GDS-related protein-like n=1 Tax=Manis pentadactyla TaxID=143292 RepID=UPI00255C8BBC|nr:ral-GDS-related protein-like [Manis pentadactyla]
MVPTIYNVMRQFEGMVRLVTTTCLRTPSITAQYRARVVEFWIQVAKECLYIRNYATLHAIVLALQSPAIRHLDSTWGHVSWWVVLSLRPGHLREQGHHWVCQCPLSGLGLPGKWQSLQTGTAGSWGPLWVR